MRYDRRGERDRRSGEDRRGQTRPGRAGSVDRQTAVRGGGYAAGQALTSAREGAAAGPQAQRGGDNLLAAAAALAEHHGEALAQAASSAGIPVAAAAAVVLTELHGLELGLDAGADGAAAGALMPIRFEPYRFWQATGHWLVNSHLDQATEQEAFDEARGLDADAAHDALRMGLGQVAGTEATAAGFADAAAMYTALRDSPAAQLEALTRVIAADDAVVQAACDGAWDELAAARAGPAFAALGYDDALAAFSDAWQRATDAVPAGIKPGDDDDDDGDDGDERTDRRKTQRRGRSARRP
jgi:hypothetical protein